MFVQETEREELLAGAEAVRSLARSLSRGGLSELYGEKRGGEGKGRGRAGRLPYFATDDDSIFNLAKRIRQPPTPHPPFPTSSPTWALGEEEAANKRLNVNLKLSASEKRLRFFPPTTALPPRPSRC